MYKKECKWCKEIICVDKQPYFASHIAACKFNTSRRPSKQKGVLKVSRVLVNCKNCNLEIEKTEKELCRMTNIFCSRSCSTSYNNKNKTTGNRRSKLEIWIEDNLKYNFEILFNKKDAIKSELDVYIPSLKLAFELNGIFHYEPIYGLDKLNSIINNDDRKFQACLENGIELCIINTTDSKRFNPNKDIVYLEIIKRIIDNKMRTLAQQQQQQLNQTD